MTLAEKRNTIDVLRDGCSLEYAKGIEALGKLVVVLNSEQGLIYGGKYELGGTENE